MTATGTDGALRRTLGFSDLMLLTLGTVIGSGIFIVPGVVLRQTNGHLGVALLVWMVGGIVSFLGALTYAELGAATPDAGGLYTYIRDAFGPLPAFLYGWASCLVIASGSVATLAVAFSAYVSQFVTLSPIGAKLVSVAVILVTAAVNARGTRDSAAVENSATTLKVAGLVIIGVALAVVGHGWSSGEAPHALWPAHFTSSVATAFGAAMIGVLWAYEGWQYVTFAAGETRDPQRVFPRAIAAATFALIVLYMLANIGYVAALGPEAAARSDHVAADATAAVFGGAAGRVISALAIISIFSAANGLMMTAPRLYYSMARDGVFFTRLARVNARTGTPIAAIIFLAAWSMVLAVSGTFEQLLTYVVFAGWIFYGLGALAVFASRRRDPHRIRPFRTPGYPITPLVFVLGAALLVANTLFEKPREASIGLAIVLLGTPVFYLWRVRARRPRAEPALTS
jgi:APA family basic amino acid/polyamine antiporter